MILCLLVCQAAGCKSPEEDKTQSGQGIVSIPMILTVDPSSGKKNGEDLVNAFNQAYQGKYQVEAEYVMETEEEYRTNLKRQNVTGKLPAVITDVRLLPS